MKILFWCDPFWPEVGGIPVIAARFAAALVERALAAPGDDFEAFDDARRQFEREYLTRILRITDGNVTQAAKLAKRNRSDFYSLLARHELDPAAFKPGKD